MGFNGENARKIVLDLETAPIDGAAEYLESVDAPANYKDPEKIAAYQREAQAGQLAKAALDPDLCRIVALGWQHGEDAQSVLCQSEDMEAIHLMDFWERFRGAHFIGYNILGFDLPVLLRRSLYLGVKAPAIQVDKYRHPQVTDLLMLLSNNGAQKFRSLSFYLKRFGLPATDGKGSEVPALVAAGDWAAVEAHLRADLLATASLAQRVGVL